ncbi:cytochrome P450 [Coprinopsis cinerea AmutBmut pab1-1]|nr:cytochrome P450 [Coprinopsis cinerea AmutBmut pab1-1]
MDISGAQNLLSRFQPLLSSAWEIIPFTSTIVAVAGALALVYLAKRSRLPLPPGPRRIPLLGNALQIPSEHPAVVYNEWAKQYGDIMYLEAMGQPIIVLNSLPVVVDLLEKRAPNFSERPATPAFEIMNYNWMFGLMSYSDPSWKAHRKTFHKFFHQSEIPKYRPILEQEMLVFLRRLSNNPSAFHEETRSYFGSIIIRISYGVNDRDYNNVLTERAERIIKGFSEVALPGNYLVNIFPSLAYVPAWFPGAGWKRRLMELAANMNSALLDSWSDAKERVVNASWATIGETALSNLTVIEEWIPKRIPERCNAGH